MIFHLKFINLKTLNNFKNQKIARGIVIFKRTFSL